MGSYKEDETIKLPLVEDGPVCIGDLWDCVNSKSAGYNLFGQKLTNEHLIAHPQRDFEYNLDYIKDTETKINTMHIEATVSLDLLAGKLKIEGGVTYDSKDNENFNHDKLECNMRLDSFVVQALPAAKNVIDPDVKALLEGQRQIKATHVCTQIYVGATACASLLVDESGKEDLMHIDGFLKGSIALGPMTASASLSLLLHDESAKEDICKKITIKSKPPTINQPTNITEMFAAINAMPQQIEKEQHFKMITDQNVVGVPLRFVLVPINQFLPDLAIKRTFLSMTADIERAYQQMMFVLVDYQIEGHFKTLVLNGDKRLLSILQDKENPLTADVMAKEKGLHDTAKELHKSASDIYDRYKKGDAEPEDLQTQIDKYNDEFRIEEVILKVEEFIMQGKALLSGVHVTDLDLETTNIKLFTNKKELEEWISQERKIKILLNTNTSQGELPGGAFLTLYNLSPFLKTFDIDVAVAYPNISENFSLIIKARHLETKYVGSDIEFALELLAVAVGQGKQIHTTFYTVLAALSGIKLPLKDNLEDLNPLIAALKETQEIKICKSYLTMREAIADRNSSDNKWKFVLEVNASESVADALHFFRKFYNTMPSDLKAQSEFMVGTFGLTGFQDAPMLFLFRNNELQAICLDNLDLLILQEKMEESIKSPDLDLLSPEKLTWRALYPTRLEFALNVLELLGQHHKALAKDTGALESLGLTDPPNENLNKAIIATKAALTGKPVDFISALAVICLQDFEDILPVFKKNGWSEVSSAFPASMRLLDWKPVAQDSKDFFQKRNPFLTIVEHTAKKIKELLEIVGTETADPENPEEPEDPENPEGAKEFSKIKTQRSSKDGEVQPPLPPPKTAEEIIDEYIAAVIAHPKCPEGLKVQIGEYVDNTNSVDIKVNGVVYVLEAFLDKRFSKGSTSNLRALINLAEKLSLEGESPDSTIMDTIAMLVRNATDEKAMEEYSGARKSLNDYLRRQNLYEILSVLSKCKWNRQLYLVHHTLFFLTKLHGFEGIDAMTQFVIDMGTDSLFSDQDYSDVWQNPKFVSFFNNGLYVDRVIDSIKVYQCKKTDTEIIIPDFLPQDFQDKIRQLIADDTKSKFPWITNWANEEILLSVFQSISVRGYLPFEFNKILQENITENMEIKDFFKTVGVLYFWNEKESLFTQPWDVYTVQKATDKIQSFLSKRNIEDIVQVDIDIICPQSHDYLECQPVTNLEFIDSWQAVADDSIFKTTTQEYRQLKRPTDKFSKEDVRQLQTTMARIIPFLQEKLKMFNTSALDPEEVLKYLPYPSDDDYNQPGKIDFETDDESVTVPFVSRTDVLICLLSCSDPNVAVNLMSRFSNTRFALPLLIPEIIKRKTSGIDLHYNSRLLLPLFKNLPIQWTPNSLSLLPQKHSLFLDPCRMIISFRIGANIPGKSFLLNSVLNKADNKDVFFSRIRTDHLQLGAPLSLDGLVEFTWLTEDTCGPELWQKAQEHHYGQGKNEALLLANVHGEIFNHLDILKELYKFASCFLVFVMPDSQADLKEKVQVLSQIVNKSDMYYMLLKGGTEDPFDLTEAMEELVSIFGTVFDHNAKPWSLDDLLEIKSPVYMPDDVQLPETKRLLNRIRIDSPPKIREIMQLQKLPQYKTKEFNDTWKNNEPLQSLISLFASILTLTPRLRNAALNHLQQEVRVMSFISTEKLRKQISELTLELLHASKSGKRDILVNVQNQLKEAKSNLANWSLDLEHFFREIGRVYEATDANMHLNYKILNSYAEHIAQSNEVEIFSQEYGTGDIMWGRWLKETLTRSRIFNKHRVFVLSVLGMTSSGKSTLLNTLFGANFAVHDGGCTRGLHMRLVFLNEQLVEETKYDAILVIDSEGLGSRGKSTDNISMIADKETETKMRKLAAFVLGISNLTLINVQEESMFEMKSILEIAFIKLLMVSNGDKSDEELTLPDVLIIQHHTNPQDTVLTELKEAIINSCTLADKNELFCGIRTRSGRKLEKILQRVKVNDVRRIFNPFSPGDSQRGPGIEYHDSAVDLYKEILGICKASTDIAHPKRFLDWYSETDLFWRENICSNLFPLEFIDSKEVNDYMNDQLAIAEVNQTIELAFKSHQNEIAKEMSPLFWFENDYPKPNDALALREETLQWLNDRLEQMTATCKILQKAEPTSETLGESEYIEVPCRPCQKALKLKEGVYSGKTITVIDYEKIHRYVIAIRENIWNHWTQALFAREMVANKSEEFENILNTITEGEYWNPRIKCNMTALKRAIALKTTVVAPERQIEIDTLDAYPNFPNLLCELENDELPQLGKIKAFDLDYYNALKNADQVDCKRKSQYLDQSQQDWIQEKMKDLPRLILSIHQAQLYEIGLIREVQEKVDKDILQTFENLENEILLPDFKWQCHLYAIKIFKQEMQKLQEKWDERNQPLLVLPYVLENYQPKPKK